MLKGILIGCWDSIWVIGFDFKLHQCVVYFEFIIIFTSIFFLCWIEGFEVMDSSLWMIFYFSFWRCILSPSKITKIVHWKLCLSIFEVLVTRPLLWFPFELIAFGFKLDLMKDPFVSDEKMVGALLADSCVSNGIWKEIWFA